MNLEELSFSVKTEQLKTAIDMVDSLAKALGNLHTVQAKETKTAIDAAKVKEAEAKAAKAVAEATIKETQAKEAGEKASKNKAKADKEVTDEVDKQNKVLERNNLILDYMRNGFSRGQSAQLAYAKMTGALTDELLSLEKVLMNQRKLMSGDPFDKSMSGMVSLRNQYGELKEAIRQYNAGTELSRQQTRELYRDKERLLEKMKMEGNSFSEIKYAIKSYNKEYVETSHVVNSMIKVERDIERAHRDSMNAVRNLTKEEERMTSVVANLSAAQNNGAALSEKAAVSIANYERNLRLAGIAGKEAADKLALYRKQQELIVLSEQKRQEQYLTRAIIPQFSDIFVGLTTGQSPFTVMLQQLPQIQDLFTLTGVKAQDTVKVLASAATEMLSRLKDTAIAVGSALGQAFLAPGKAATEFALRVTGINAVMDKYYSGLLDQGPPDRFTAGMIRMGSAAKSFLNILVGVGVAGIVGGLAMVLASFISVIKEQDRLAVSMGQFGQSMGVSFQSAILLTESLRSINIGSAKATESLIAMASTGKFVAAEFQMVTVAAVNMQKYAGISIEETVKSFAKMKEKPVEALYELAQATGMVTSAQISWISELVRTDRQTEASAAAIQILADVNAKQTERMKENLSGFAIFMKNLGSSISGFFDSAFKALWSKTDERALLVQKIEALKPSLDNKLLAAGTKADIAVLEQQLKMIDQTRKAQDDLAASQKSGQKAQQEFLEKINKYEDKDKVKMARAGSRAEYIKTEIEEYKKLYKEMTKTEEELGKRMYGEKWDNAHKAKTGKSVGEKEADRIKKYYDRIVEGANNANEETKGLAEGLNKYEIALNKVQNDDYFSKLSKVQQNNIGNLYKQAIAQEDVNIVQKLYNNLLGQADGLGADYYERLKVIARAADAGFDPAIIDKLQKKLYETTEQGKQYVSFMNELIKKTEELAIARAKLEGERNAVLVGGVQGEYLKEQLSYQEKLAKAQKDYNAEQAKVNEFYISKSKAPADEEMRIAAMEKLKSVYDSTVANISFEQQTASLGKFTEQFSILIQSVELLGTSLTNVFGEFGSTLGNALSSFANLAAGMDQNARQIQAAMQSVADAKQKVIESSSYEELIKNTKKQTDAENVLAKTQKKSALSEITMYANLAGAAKSMFGEKTAAAKAFGAIEKVLHIARIGMMLVEVAQTIASVGPTVAANAAKTTSTMGSMVVDGAAAVVKTLASLPFPANVAAGAAVAALVAGIIGSVGGSFNGGSGSSSAAPVNEGTGTVFGDSSAKSESFAQAEEYLAEANLLTQKYTPQMLVHLRNIDAQIAGLVNLIIRTGDVQNATSSLGIKTGNTYSAVGQIADKITAPLRDFVTKWLPVVGAGDDKLVRALIGGIFGKVSTSVTGQGLTGEKQSLGNIMTNQFQGQYYTDVQVKKKSWFSSSTKNQTYLTEAGAELEQQITAVFKGIYDSVLVATESLGQSQSTIRDVLDSFEVDIGRVSLQGTGAEIQERLSAVFGAAADSIAKAAMPGLEQFQNVGEGYFATLIRVATELDTVNGMFDMLGNTLFTLGISGVEASQSLIGLFGGLSEFQSSVSEYYDKFYTEEEKVVKQGEQLTKVFSNLGLTLPEISGDLQTSLNAYRDMVNSFDLTDPAQQEAYYSLIQLSDAFYDVALAASTTQKSVEELLADLNNQVRTDEDIANSTYDLQQDTRQLQATYDDLISGATGANSALYKLTTEGMHPLEKAAYDNMLAQKSLIDSHNAQTKSVEALNTSLTNARSGLIDSYKAESTALDSTISRLKSFAQGIKQFKDSLQLGALSPLTPGQKYAESSKQFEEIYKAAIGGDQNAQSQLQSAAQNFLEASKIYNASGEGYVADFQRVNAILDQVSSSTADTIAIAQAQLDVVKNQLTALGNINNSVKTVQDAIDVLANAVMQAINAGINPGATNVGALTGGVTGSLVNTTIPGTSAYQSSAGAAALETSSGLTVYGKNKTTMTDSQIRDYVYQLINLGNSKQVYDDAKSFGITLAELDKIMYWTPGTSEDWAKENNLPAFAEGTNRLNKDMIAQVHTGEAIIPAKFNPWNGGTMSFSNSEMITEIKALREEVKTLRVQQHEETVAIIQGQNQAAENSAHILSTNNSRENWFSNNRPEIN